LLPLTQILELREIVKNLKSPSFPLPLPETNLNLAEALEIKYYRNPS